MTFIKEPDDTSSWGTYALHGMEKFVYEYLPMAGLSRGFIRKKIRKAWFKKNPTPLDIELFGIKYRLYPWDNRAERNLPFTSLCYNDEELKVLKQFVKKDGIFFDIGANIGYYSLNVASWQVKKCYAFEPIQQVRQRQAYNIKINGFEETIVQMPYALGDHDGNAEIWVTPDQLHSSSLTLEQDHQDAKSFKIDIAVQTLNTAVTSHNIEKIDGMKIDAEGMEDRVLLPFFEQAEKSVWPKCVIMEHTARQHWKNDVIDWMKKNDYKELTQLEGNIILTRD